jgi:phage pi2 protein 07
MLTQLEIEELKNDGFTFEDINSLSKRMESIDNGTAVFYEEEDFWSLVKSDMNEIIINREKCIR